MRMTATGNLNPISGSVTAARPSQLKRSGNWCIDSLFDQSKAIPLAISIAPSVTMNGGNEKRVTESDLFKVEEAAKTAKGRIGARAACGLRERRDRRHQCVAGIDINTGLAVSDGTVRDGAVGILAHRVEGDLVRVGLICYTRRGNTMICSCTVDRAIAALTGCSCQIDPALPEYGGSVKAVR